MDGWMGFGSVYYFLVCLSQFLYDACRLFSLRLLPAVHIFRGRLFHLFSVIETPMSAVARSAAYEKHIVESLHKLGIRSKSRGGAGTVVWTLLGTWESVAPAVQQCQVVVQCKSHSKPVGPSAVRELIASLEHWSQSPSAKARGLSHVSSSNQVPMVACICVVSRPDPSSWTVGEQRYTVLLFDNHNAPPRLQAGSYRPCATGQLAPPNGWNATDICDLEPWVSVVCSG